jgi:hypothetical protein
MAGTVDDCLKKVPADFNIDYCIYNKSTQMNMNRLKLLISK